MERCLDRWDDLKRNHIGSFDLNLDESVDIKNFFRHSSSNDCGADFHNHLLRHLVFFYEFK